MWEQILRGLTLFFGPLVPVAIPAFFGALIRQMQQDRRKRRRLGIIRIVASILMSCICGGFLTPLFSHLFHLSSEISSSVSFLLGYLGLEGLNMVLDFFHRHGRHRDGRFDRDVSDTDDGDGAE